MGLRAKILLFSGTAIEVAFKALHSAGFVPYAACGKLKTILGALFTVAEECIQLLMSTPLQQHSSLRAAVD